MTPERWRHVRSVFDRAIAIEAEHCPVFLDQACGGDAALRREVETLLLSHAAAGEGFLARPAVDLAGSSPAPAPHTGGRIGAYELIEEIGHCGMGDVYRARRVGGQYVH